MIRVNVYAKRGFTLVELMVAMAIIAVLAGAIWGNFFSSMGKSRDSRRKQDLQTIAKAFELYYNDHGYYPTTEPTWGDLFAHETNPTVIYMQKVPNDPAYPSATYCYETDTNGTYFKLYANLENRNDADVIYDGRDCNGVTYNYILGSSNAQ